MLLRGAFCGPSEYLRTLVRQSVSAFKTQIRIVWRGVPKMRSGTSRRADREVPAFVKLRS